MSKSLVLVVGAGASYEVQLPLGVELKRQIASLLDIRYDYHRISGDSLIDGAFRHITAGNGDREGINPYLFASWRIRDAMPQAISIDNFIDAHREDFRITQSGKLAIARSILLAEAKSPLNTDPRNGQDSIDFSKFDKTWFNTFFQVLTENCKQSDLEERLSQVAIICFNYDRCIEHYMYQALQNYYGMQPQEAATILQSIEIFHPYGTVGDLPWSRPDKGGIAFGATPSAQQLVELSTQLRTFTEGSDEATTDITRIRSLLADTERIAFLGFAFHRLNVELLFPRQEQKVSLRGTEVYATGIGISAADAKVIADELKELAGLHQGNTTIERSVACAGLFTEFRRSLSFR